MTAAMDVGRDRVITDLAGWLKATLPAGGQLRSDSRSVMPGDAFFAYPGERSDGRAYASQALARGAAALVFEGNDQDSSERWPVPSRGVRDLKRLSGPIAHVYFGAPTAQLQVLAVTGTNGKTSCSQWIAQGLQSLGRRSAVIGTLGAGRPDMLTDFGLTTPDALALQAQFADFRRQGVEVVAMEASSIGLEQHRLDGTRIAVAVFTNLTRDHLDYHGTMSAYAQAKARLFAWPSLGAAVLNLDDPWSATMRAALAPSTPCIGYGIDAHQTDTARATREAHTGPRLLATAIESTAQGMRMTLEGDWGTAAVETSLIGRFNVANLLAVASAWLALGVPFEAVVAQLRTLTPVPGRLQPVTVAGAGGPLAVVDYAHTPDALSNALAALRPVTEARGGKLWCVVGAGGDRDPGKRPLMGAVAERDADHAVITSDNPRSEAPEQILDAIVGGMSVAPRLRDADRARAIAAVLDEAADQDVVLIAGKGHETYQEVSGVRHPFDDRDHAAQALTRRAVRKEARRV